jgi:hypothetical protein
LPASCRHTSSPIPFFPPVTTAILSHHGSLLFARNHLLVTRLLARCKKRNMGWKHSTVHTFCSTGRKVRRSPWAATLQETLQFVTKFTWRFQISSQITVHPWRTVRFCHRFAVLDMKPDMKSKHHDVVSISS